VSGTSGERNVRASTASCTCSRAPDASHPSSEEGLSLLEFFFSIPVHQNVVLTKSLNYSTTLHSEARARWRIKMSHSRPPVAREFHGALFPRLFFRVGGKSTRITDQSPELPNIFQILFRRPICMSLSQHCSVLARCSPLACLQSCSTRLLTPHYGVSVALCALLARKVLMLYLFYRSNPT
jgi:hypothetical protein